ncbi:Glucanosyltransferase-domain-containing protein [Protomyces lactucae-debilis]|uniref:1,3-beta-glucanosyltransferase n=1 Tax=Protomyces lactucae-debilis TaxID=2754530 RepID=A0A1Y2EQ53_PROLT|nr:Glucanosyltransferase-domain-containing protein [Protomyces lactucae-debilis]ORY73679.1 Glucanosyltransferase-domain-containing protein [Protomyces lactucae-debilis]
MHFSIAVLSLAAACFSQVAAQSSVSKSETPLATKPVSTAASQATTPITIKGNTFMRGNERFFLVGVDYQPGGSSDLTDPLSNPTICARDIAVMQTLGINTIRIYTVDNSVDHDECMSLLSKAGIYLVLDINTPQSSLNRNDAASSYNLAYMQHLFATVDAFKKYPNVLGFFAGNEVINDAPTVGTAPWIKAVIRDVKQYIAAQSTRAIPVGYSSTDVPGSRYKFPEYLNCGNASTRADFIGTNVYSYCGDSSFTQSGYDQLVAGFSDLTIPLFMSEFGCNQFAGDQSKGRAFSEVATIYSKEMTSVFSGGLVYEYTQEVNNYGLVTIGSNGQVSALPDFYNLQKQYAALKLDKSAPGTSKTTAPACPGNSTDFEGVWAEDVLPVQPAGAAALIKNGAGAPLGNGGSGSQNAGSGSGSGSGNSNVGLTSSTTSGSARSASPSASATRTSGAQSVLPTLSMGMLAAWSLTLSAAFGAALFF